MCIVIVVIVLCSFCFIAVLCCNVLKCVEMKVVWTKWSLMFLFLFKASIGLMAHSSWRLSSS